MGNKFYIPKSAWYRTWQNSNQLFSYFIARLFTVHEWQSVVIMVAAAFNGWRNEECVL